MRNHSSENAQLSPPTRGKHLDGDEYIVTGEIPPLTPAESARLRLMFEQRASSISTRTVGQPWGVEAMYEIP